MENRFIKSNLVIGMASGWLERLARLFDVVGVDALHLHRVEGNSTWCDIESQS